MKHLILYSILTAGLFTATVLSMNDIIQAFKKGSATDVATYLDNSVEITLASQNSTYNKQQASKIITDFFSENKVSDFKVLHQSESSGTAYCIGNLSTSGGTYRLTLFAKDKNGKTLLQEIRFEK